MTRLLRAALLALPVAVVLAGPALAASPAEVAGGLRGDRVFVEPGVTTDVDVARVRAAAERVGLDVYVAIVGQADVDDAGGRQAFNTAVGRALGRQDAALLTVVGRDVTGGAGCGVGLDTGVADQVARAGTGGAQARILAAIQNLDERTSGGTLASGCAGGSSGSGGGMGTGGAIALAVLGAGAVGGVTALVVRNRKRRDEFDEADRADVESLYSRLSSEVTTLSPGDDPIAQQALVDAAERYTATGAAMATADSGAEWAVARRTAVEGLTAARKVRTQLGLDPGPDIPPPPGHGSGPQLLQRTRVQVGEEEYEGTPDYEPGHAHHYGGGTVSGQQVPGGWYPSRFWEGLLLGGLLSGGFSGGSDRDDDRHEHPEHHDHGHSGSGAGDWGGGSSGGGDWGGGGKGDW